MRPSAMTSSPTNALPKTSWRWTSTHRPISPSDACLRSFSRTRVPWGDAMSTSCARRSSSPRALLRPSWRHSSSSRRPSWRRNVYRCCALRRRVTIWLVLPLLSILVRVVTGGTAIFAHKRTWVPANHARCSIRRQRHCTSVRGRAARSDAIHESSPRCGVGCSPPRGARGRDCHIFPADRHSRRP